MQVRNAMMSWDEVRTKLLERIANIPPFDMDAIHDEVESDDSARFEDIEGPPPSPEIIATAMKLIDVCEEMRVPTPTHYCCSLGDIALEWHLSERFIVVIVQMNKRNGLIKGIWVPGIGYFAGPIETARFLQSALS